MSTLLLQNNFIQQAYAEKFCKLQPINQQGRIGTVFCKDEYDELRGGGIKVCISDNKLLLLEENE